MIVKLIYDHRVLDGAYVARRLRDIEEVLNGAILHELLERDGIPVTGSVPGVPPQVEPLLKPHFQSTAPGAEAERLDQAASTKD